MVICSSVNIWILMAEFFKIYHYFFCLGKSFIVVGVQLLYNVELVSAIQQSESVTHIHLLLFSRQVVSQLFATPLTAEHQASLSLTISWRLPKFMSIELVMPSNHSYIPFV